MTTQALVIADENGVIGLWNSVAVELFGHGDAKLFVINE